MRRAEPVAGLGGIALLVALFLPWYAGPGGSVTAWTAFTVIDYVLALLGLLAILVPVSSLASSGPSRPVAVAVLTSAFGWIAVVLVVFRLIDAPADGLELRYGAWIALAASLLGWAGGWLSLRDESTPGAAPATIPRRPAPPA